MFGTTAPLWAMVLALCADTGAPIEQASLAISLACDACSAFLLFPLAGAMLFLGLVAAQMAAAVWQG